MDNSSVVYYPKLDDINFNTKLIKKKEFNQYISESLTNKTIEDLCFSNYFITRPIQRMLQSYLSPNTPYNGLLLFHTTGSGKTCTSILIAEQFIDYVQSNNSFVYLIASPILIENFNDTIFNSNKIDINKNNTKQCTGYIYSKIYEQYLKDTKNNMLKAKNLIKEYKNIRYKSYGYIALVNSITKNNNEYVEPEIIKSRFSNSVFIIDEAHRIANTQTYNGLEYILKHADNVKLLLLTATPMFDKTVQIVDLLNLLLINDNRPTISYNDIFEPSVDDNRVINNNELFTKLTTGYVSYLNGINPISFPLKLYPENSIFIKLNEEKNNILIAENSRKHSYNIFPCEMSSHQYNISTKYKINENYDNIDDNNLAYGIQSNLIVFPNDKVGDEGFNVCFNYNKDLDKYSYNCFNDFLIPKNVKKYSIKLYNLSKELTNKNLTGKIFISSRYIKSGVYITAMMLEELGFNRIKYVNGNFIVSNLLKKNPPDSPNYIMISSNITTHQMKEYINYYNHIDNINGNNVQIIIGSAVIHQGVNLLGIREIHILDPWWNYSYIEQIIGRGLRDCSHINLPPQKRNVTIYNYISTHQNNITNDIKQVIKTLYKTINIKQISAILKKNAIDCFISKNININKNYPDIEITTSKNNKLLVSQNDIDYSIECDYDICDYECTGIDKKQLSNIDTSTYDYFNDTISNINVATLYIKKLFELKLFYTFEQISSAITSQDKYININTISLALQNIVLNKITVFDKFNRNGYIIHKDDYYIYQPEEITDEFIPIYLRKYPLKYRLHSIKNLIKKTQHQNNLNISTSPTTDISMKNNYYEKLVINKIFSENKLYNHIFANIPKSTVNNMLLFDVLFLYIDYLDDTKFIMDILMTSHPSTRYSIHFVNNFSNELFSKKFKIFKQFFNLELVSTDYKSIILQYIIIKSILNKPFTELEEFIVLYHKDILISIDNKYVGFILYKHNPNYTDEYNNGNDPHTEIPFIYVYYKNTWYSNLSIDDTSYININIKNIINSLLSKYNHYITEIRNDILNNSHALALIGKLPIEDTSVLKIIQFVEQKFVKKKEKLTNITISTIKDLQISNIVNIYKSIIDNVKSLMNKYNLTFNIQDYENELNIFINDNTFKKKYVISLIAYLLLDLHLIKFADRHWFIYSHQSAILKRSSLFNISRTDKQNISLSIHKGLAII